MRNSLALLCLLLVAPAPVWAAASAPRTAAAQARASFYRGQKAYNLGRFADALEAYTEAYRLDPRPAMLFNLGQCHRLLGNSERALFFYNRYLSQFPGVAPNDATVRGLIAEMEHATARQRLSAGDAPQAAPTPSIPDLAPTASGLAENNSPLQAVDSAPPQGSQPLYKKWWLWAAVGAVAAGTVTAYVATAPHPRAPSLGTQDLR